GYRTRNILCMPIRNDRGAIIGVVQVLNKIGGPFTRGDEELLDALASQVSGALENAQLFEETVYLKNYNESVLNSMATGVISVGVEGQVATHNPAAARIFRFEDAVGRAVADLLHSPRHVDEIAELPEALRANVKNAALVEGLMGTLSEGTP